MTRLFNVLAVAAAIGICAPGVQAQSGIVPQEVPPSSFTGSQYVDSRGCAFIRAGREGAVQWVPRVTRDRRLICGLEPTQVTDSASAAPANVGSPEVLVLQPSPATAEPLTPRTPSRIDAPTGARVGTVVTLETAASKGVSPTTRVLPRHLYDGQDTRSAVKVPEGYRSVWQDDRLNPRRAEQSLSGHGKMRQIWTQTTPLEPAKQSTDR